MNWYFPQVYFGRAFRTVYAKRKSDRAACSQTTGKYMFGGTHTGEVEAAAFRGPRLRPVSTKGFAAVVRLLTALLLVSTSLIVATSSPAAAVDLVPNDDLFTVALGTTTMLDVLANDAGDGLFISSYQQPNEGSVTCGESDPVLGRAVCQFSPDPVSAGTSVGFSYTIEDVNGNTAAVSVTVDVSTNTAPSIYPESFAKSGPLRDLDTFNVLSNDFDRDGDPLTIIAAAVVSGDLQDLSCSTVCTARLYTLEASLSYTVSDGNGGVRTSYAVIRHASLGQNLPPIANDDDVIINAGGSLDVEVLLNDNDPEGNPLTVLGGAEGSDTLSAAGRPVTCNSTLCRYEAGPDIPDEFRYVVRDSVRNLSLGLVRINGGLGGGAPLLLTDDTATARGVRSVALDVLSNDGVTATITNVEIVTPPTNGSALCGFMPFNPGLCVYTSTLITAGTDSFRYRVKAGGRTGEATVNVTRLAAVNPVANADSPPQFRGAATIRVLDNDTNVGDEDVLGYLTAVSLINPAAHPQVDCTRQDPSDAHTVCRYTAAAGSTGSDSFEYTIANSAGGVSAPALVSVSWTANTAPVIVTTGAAVISTRGTQYVSAPVGTVSDADGDALAVRTEGASLGSASCFVSSGTITCGYRAFVNPATNSTDSFDAIVSDERGGESRRTVNVLLRPNQPSIARNDPEVAGDPRYTFHKDSGDLPVFANDTYAPVGPYYFSNTSLYSASTPVGSVTCDRSTTSPACRVSANLGFAGPAEFRYTLSDDAGGTSTATVSVVVRPNTPPVANPDALAIRYSADPAALNLASNDTDADGDPLSVQRSAGLLAPTKGSVTSCGGAYCHYQFNGPNPPAGAPVSDSFGYEVNDGNGGVAASIASVTVHHNTAPTAVSDSVSIAALAPVYIRVLDNDTDADDGSDGGPVDSVRSVVLSAFANTGTGTVECVFSQCIFTPSVGATGTDSFTYRITDEWGAQSAPATVSISYDSNRSPIANPDSFTVASAPLSLPVLTNDSDPDGDPFVIDSVVVNPATGVVTCSTPTCTYTPNVGPARTDSFRYRVKDARGATAEALVTLTIPANTAPLALADSGSVRGSVPLAVLVLSNDEDDAPLGEIVLQSCSSETDGAVKDLVGGIVGSVSVRPGGLFAAPYCQFVANAGFSGTARFTYTIADRLGATAFGVVTVTVSANGSPVAANDSYTRRSGLSHLLNVTSNDVDPENDGLTARLITQAQHGTAACSSTSCTYESTAGYQGPDSFVYEIKDDHGGTAQGTVNLTITINQIPIVVNDSASGHGINPIQFNVLSNDSDPDGDPLSVASLGALDPLLGSVSLGAPGPVHGNVVYTPPPGSTFAGSAMFTYTVIDGAGGTAVGQITVTWTRNNPPTKVDDPNIGSVRPGEWSPYFYPLTNDFDLDGDTLSMVGFTQPGRGALLCFGTACTFNLTDLAYRGPLSFDYTISDGQGATSIGTATFTVADNRAPIASAHSLSAPPAGESAAIGLVQAASDPDEWPVVGIEVHPTPTTTDIAPTPDPFLDVASCTPSGAMAGSVARQSETRIAYRQGNGALSATRIRGLGCLYTSPTPRPSTGIDSFTYEVRDWQGLVTTGVVEVYFDGSPPVDIDFLPSAGSGSMRVWGGYSETLRLSAGGIGARVTTTSTPGHGVATCSLGDRSVNCSYRATNGYVGPDSFTYEVTDYLGRTAVGTISIDARDNRFPIVDGEAATITSGYPIYLLASSVRRPNPGPTAEIDLNDSEPDNPPDSPFVNIQDSSYSLLSGPQHGWLLPSEISTRFGDWIDPARVDSRSFRNPPPPCIDFPFCRYRSFPGYAGEDTITYVVEDGHGGLASAVVTFTVTPNPAPVAGVGSAITTMNRPTNVPVAGPAGAYIDVSTADTRSTGGGFVDCILTRCTYIPPLNFVGADTFTYRLVDGFGGSPSADRVVITVTVSPNRAPIAVSDALAVVNGTTKSLRPLLNDTDPDPGHTVQLVSSVGPSLIRGVTVTCNGDTCSYPAEAGFVGADRFEYTITDGQLTSTGSVVVSVLPTGVGPNCLPYVRTLSNGTPATDDRTVAVEVDGKGSFLTALYNPDGPSPAGNTVYGSSVYVGSPISQFLEDSCAMTIDEGQSNSSKLVTSGVVDGLGIDLTQEVLPADSTGSTLEQRYVFTNTLNAAVPTRLVRSLDGDLFFDGRKIDGAAASIDGSTLFEFDNTNVPSVASDAISISGSVDGRMVPNGWTIQPYSVSRLNDTSGAVDGKVFNDIDGNRVTDSAYDVVLTQQWNVVIPLGGSVSFTTRTRFGRVAPNVVNVAPVAVDDSNIQVPFGSPTSINVLANDSDADHDLLTVSIVEQGTKGVATVLPDGNIRYVPATNAVGTDSLVYEITDGRGGTSGAVVRLLIGANEAPKAPARTLVVDEDVAGSITLTATDAEGAILSFSIGQAPLHGDIVCAPTYLCVYIPATNYHGTDSFTYVASDGLLSSTPAEVNVTVRPVNDAPASAPQTVTTPQDTALPITLTGSDIDGDTLSFTVVANPTRGSLSGIAPNLAYTPNANYRGADSFTFKATDGNVDSGVSTVSINVTAVNHAPVAIAQSVSTDEDLATSITIAGTDRDGDPLTYTLGTPPAHGTLSGTAPGYTYTPDLNFNGADSFTFTANDATLSSVSATVSITARPVNDRPTAAAIAMTTPEETAKTITLIGTDVDLDPLTYVVVSLPSHGTLTGTGAPTLTYTPALNFSGADSFTFLVSDATTSSAEARVSIFVTPVNDAPSATPQTVATPEDTAIPITLAGVDVDSNTLTFSVTARPAHGILTGSAASQTYHPAVGFVGEDSFTFTVSDGLLTSTPATVTINVTAVNHAPVADAQTVSVVSGVALPIVLTGSDRDSGDVITFAVSSPAHGTLTVAGAKVIYTANGSYVGEDSFTFTVSDGSLTSAPATVTITVSAPATTTTSSTTSSTTSTSTTAPPTSTTTSTSPSTSTTLEPTTTTTSTSTSTTAPPRSTTTSTSTTLEPTTTTTSTTTSTSTSTTTVAPTSTTTTSTTSTTSTSTSTTVPPTSTTTVVPTLTTTTSTTSTTTTTTQPTTTTRPTTTTTLTTTTTRPTTTTTLTTTTTRPTTTTTTTRPTTTTTTRPTTTTTTRPTTTTTRPTTTTTTRPTTTTTRPTTTTSTRPPVTTTTCVPHHDDDHDDDNGRNQRQGDPIGCGTLTTTTTTTRPPTTTTTGPGTTTTTRPGTTTTTRPGTTTTTRRPRRDDDDRRSVSVLALTTSRDDDIPGGGAPLSNAGQDAVGFVALLIAGGAFLLFLLAWRRRDEESTAKALG